MKKLYILTLLTCLIPQQIHAIEPSVFKKAEPEDPNQTRVAIELSTAEKLFIKVTEGIIVVLVDEPISLREKGTLTESCRFDFSFIKKTQVSSDSFLSSVTYKVDRIDETDHLTRIEGTQDLFLGGLKLSWSYSSPYAVYIYMPNETEYAVTN